MRTVSNQTMHIGIRRPPALCQRDKIRNDCRLLTQRGNRENGEAGISNYYERYRMIRLIALKFEINLNLLATA